MVVVLIEHMGYQSVVFLYKNASKTKVFNYQNASILEVSVSENAGDWAVRYEGKR